jgi:hypothetical protein
MYDRKFIFACVSFDTVLIFNVLYFCGVNNINHHKN